MSHLSFCFRPSIFGYQNSLIQPYDGQVRPEIVFGIGTPITCSNPFLSILRTLQKHWGNNHKFGSCPLRSKTLVFPGFFAFLASSFGFPAYPCMSMPAGAAPVENIVLCAALDPGESSCESPESSSNPRFSRENMWFCSGGAGFELLEFES
jgi:hypothetical protein